MWKENESPAMLYVNDKEVEASVTVLNAEQSPDGEIFSWTGLNLTPEEAMSLYREGILPDAEAGHIGRSHLVMDEAYYEEVCPVNVNITLRAPEQEGYRAYFYLNVSVERDSVNTLRWLAGHTALELKTWAEQGVVD